MMCREVAKDMLLESTAQNASTKRSPIPSLSFISTYSSFSVTKFDHKV